ncbi:nuclear GTPase SLIP-GC-like isoform X2 [Sardina pilchardus]|uniref:nuclear GTPase SLIP-GC-like isoform X2 n=1 Tax=Sardina pilchardus TaxID=27697 RepID=UPI002E13D975
MKKIEADANEETDAFSQYIRSLIKDPKSKKTKVGVIGRTGVGKSYLINTILGEKVLPSGSELACTSVIIQVEANDPQKTDFTAEIKLISKQDWEHELEILRQILDKGTREYEESDVKSARDKIKAVYGQDGVNKTLEELKSVVIPDLVDKTENGPTAEELERAIRRYVKSGEADSTQLFYWPLVKSVTIKVPGHNDILENLVLIDLPGTGDINKSRREMGKNCRRECSTMWILSDINRADSDQSSWDILSFHLKEMRGGECNSITYICTKTDQMDAEDADNYMSDNNLTEKGLGITQEQLTKDEKIKIRKCIEHRNKQSKADVENTFLPKIKAHSNEVDFKIFTVSSKGFQKQDNDCVLSAEDTEIPALRELLQDLNVSFSKKMEDEYIKEVGGVLSLIQGSKCDGHIDVEIAKEKRQAYRTLNEKLTKALTDLCQSLENKYNDLDQCLSKLANESMAVSPKEAEEKVIKPERPNFRGYHRTLKALCMKGGFTISKDPESGTEIVTDLNDVLVSHMKVNVDKIFNDLFERRSRQAQFVLALLEQFDPIGEVMKEFTHLKLILFFIKTQRNKRKTELNGHIRQMTKEIYNCLSDTIESVMLPVYDKAASESGEGAFGRMQQVLRKGIEEHKATMYTVARLKMLEKFDHMTNHIEKTLRELQDIVADALSLRFSLPLPDITEEVERMKRVVEQIRA